MRALKLCFKARINQYVLKHASTIKQTNKCVMSKHFKLRIHNVLKSNLKVIEKTPKFRFNLDQIKSNSD